MNSPHKTFVDSNILIYAFDESEEDKRIIANRVLIELWSQKSGFLSVQVLQEFCWNVTRKIQTPISIEMTARVVGHYSEWCGETTAKEVQAALRIESRHKISFWDSLIVALAAKAAASRILSEDMNHGQIIEGIEIINPFL